VYRANDTKLGREVAIKVLPAVLAQHAERLARFERKPPLLTNRNSAPNLPIIVHREIRSCCSKRGGLPVFNGTSPTIVLKRCAGAFQIIAAESSRCYFRTALRTK
jgi:hypothetical protein